MADDKLFFKYHSLRPATGKDGAILKDENGKNIIYSINNLANNQLYFNDPTKFNDPFDCKFVLVQIGTRKQWLNDYERDCNHVEAVKLFNHNLKYGLLTKEQDGLYSYDFIKDVKLNIDRGFHRKEDYRVYKNSIGESRKQIGIDINDYLRSMALPLVSCFSGTDKNILMWSHYADYHQGICLRFRSYKRVFKVNENPISDFFINSGFVEPDNEYCLLDLYAPITNILAAPNIFFKIDYKVNPERLNDFDKNDEKMFKFLITKYTDWQYENEYRLMVSKDIPENNVLKYRKNDLEGVIFGLKTGYDDAKLVYETIKDNYFDKGFTVNFYEAKEVVGKYEVEPVLINDVAKYLDDLV
jgi:hypothetical protein